MRIEVGQIYKQCGSKSGYSGEIRYRVDKINGQAVYLTVIAPENSTKKTYSFLKSQLYGFLELAN